MNKRKEKNIRRLVKNLLCMDETSLSIMKTNSEVLKLRDKLDSETKKAG